MVLDKNNPQVEEIITKQIGPTIYETQLTVVWSEFGIFVFVVIFNLVWSIRRRFWFKIWMSS